MGGYAVSFYGYPRFTKDIDVFYQLDPKNLCRLKSALVSFGFQTEELADDLFLAGNILKIGIEPMRIDLLNEIDGIAYQAAEEKKVRGPYGTIEVSYISKQDLILNKRASNHLQDQVDVFKLSESEE